MRPEEDTVLEIVFIFIKDILGISHQLHSKFYVKFFCHCCTSGERNLTYTDKKLGTIHLLSHQQKVLKKLRVDDHSYKIYI
jgi:hypothetical protein